MKIDKLKNNAEHSLLSFFARFLPRNPFLMRDARLVGAVSLIWIAFILIMFSVSGGTDDNDYFIWSYGPSNRLKLLGVRINTWTRWFMLSAVVVVDACVNVWVLEVVHTWLNNNIYRLDDRVEFGNRWAMFISLALNIYTCTHNIIALFLMLTQADIQAMVITVNVTLTYIIVNNYLHAKVTPYNELPHTNGGGLLRYQLDISGDALNSAHIV